MNFVFVNEESIWDLISKIIEFIIELENDQKKYIFIFDQYNDKIDKNSRLTKIFDEYSQNKGKKQIGIISLSSMNNNDIKIYKINFIKKEFGLKIDDEIFFNKSLQELNNIIDIEEFKFVDDTYEEYFELLGKNIKNYNILNNYYTNQKDIKKYIDERKKEIQNKIEFFYECEKDDKNIIRLHI